MKLCHLFSLLGHRESRYFVCALIVIKKQTGNVLVNNCNYANFLPRSHRGRLWLCGSFWNTVLFLETIFLTQRKSNENTKENLSDALFNYFILKRVFSQNWVNGWDHFLRHQDQPNWLKSSFWCDIRHLTFNVSWCQMTHMTSDWTSVLSNLLIEFGQKIVLKLNNWKASAKFSFL